MSTYLDLILLFVMVVLIYSRLNKVLGTKPDNNEKVFEKQEFDTIEVLGEKALLFTKKKKAEDDNSEQIVQIEKNLALNCIPDFSKEDFCLRCAKVFEMVISAFASADEKTLKMLTDKKLFTKFQQIIKSRKEEGITAETDLIRIEDMAIEDVKISPKGMVKIMVKFITEQINLLRNAAGEVIEGDENFVQKITDFWTFEKDINSTSPTWFLVSTKKNKA